MTTRAHGRIQVEDGPTDRLLAVLAESWNVATQYNHIMIVTPAEVVRMLNYLGTVDLPDNR